MTDQQLTRAAASMSSSACAWTTVRGNPSSTNPGLASGWLRRSRTRSVIRSSLTSAAARERRRDLLSERRPVPDRGAEDVAGRDVRNPVGSASRTACVPLPDPGGPMRTTVEAHVVGLCPVGGHVRYGRQGESSWIASLSPIAYPSTKAWCRCRQSAMLIGCPPRCRGAHRPSPPRSARLVVRRQPHTTRTATAVRGPKPRAQPAAPPGPDRRKPGNGLQLRRRSAARRRRLRPSVPRPPARAVPRRARDPLHQGQHAHRRLAPRGVLRAAARRTSAGHSHLRRVPAARGRRTQVLYCLALEYARFGDLSAYLRRHGGGWPERTARREIAGILEVLGKLHRGQLLHRDLTPLNVFVCDGRQLKLGDFGIVQQQSDRRGITARTMNALTAPSDILAGTAPKWQARDDVYQVGQLLGMLIKGDARSRIRTPDVRRLAVQRPPEGDRLSLPRRAPQALRERRRADRRAAQSAERRSTSACCARSRACTSPSPASSASPAATPSAPRGAPARSSTADRRRRPRSSSAGVPTRCRPRAATPG